MAWTELNPRQHERVGDRYATDLTDAEWALIEPLLPPRKATGRPRTSHLRDVSDAILYIATTGCQWRMLPNDFPPVPTVRGYFTRGTTTACGRKRTASWLRPRALRRPRRPADCGDYRQSKRENHRSVGGHGYDAGERIKGRKRHVVTDTAGLLVGPQVHSAGIRDRDGAPNALEAVAARYPMLRHIFADGGYAGPSSGRRSRRSGGGRSRSSPRRWVVERTLAWPGRCRRLSKDWEKSIASAEAWLLIAHIRRVTRHLARPREPMVSSEPDSERMEITSRARSSRTSSRPRAARYA